MNVIDALVSAATENAKILGAAYTACTRSPQELAEWSAMLREEALRGAKSTWKFPPVPIELVRLYEQTYVEAFNRTVNATIAHLKHSHDSGAL